MAISIQDAIRIFALVNPQAANKANEVLTDYWQAVGSALTKDQQDFVSQNLKALPKFLRSEEGKIAVQTLVEDWKASLK